MNWRDGILRDDDERRHERHGGRRIDQVVEVLATKVRVLALGQVAEGWFSDLARPKDAARESLRRGAKEGLLATAWGMAHPRVPILAPLYRFEAEAQTPPPIFGRLSWEARRRFSKAPVRTLFAIATNRGKQAYGQTSRHRPIRRSELTHDIHVAEIYLRFRELDPERARLWQGEDQFDGHLVRPDAVTGDVAIDFLGKYSSAKIEALERQYRSAGICVFEFW